MTKLPDNAKKVFEGVFFNVYQWEQEVFDGSKKTFEAATRDASIEIIPVIGDKILVNEEEQPYVGKFMDVPGGRGEKNETPEETALRELEEETGYVPESVEVFYHHPHKSTKLLWPHYIFIGKNCKKIKESEVDAGEKISSKLVSFKEFLEIVEQKKFRNVILRDAIFRIKHTPGELEKFKEKLFN